jgi:thymidylate kinase
MEKRRKIVAIEGIDFVGKSTQMKMFKEDGYPTGFEPGQSALGVELSPILRTHNLAFNPMSRFLLFMADRIETNKLMAKQFPSKLKSSWYQRWFEKPIIMDRSIVSGIGYGIADGLDQSWMQRIANSNSEVFPDFVVILEIDEDTYKERAAKVKLDVLEDVDYSVMIERKYGLRTACGNLNIPHVVINANCTPTELNKRIRSEIHNYFK